MKQISKETKTFKLLEAFKEGETLTPAMAEKRFGIKNLSAEASRLRYNGHAIYSKTRKSGNGITVTEYHLGRPSRSIVALGYKARAMGIEV